MANNVFNQTAALRPGRSVFDLSYDKKLTCDMGELIPIMCDEVIPGDSFTIGNEIVLRFQPLIAPILHEVNVYVHYFFVPYRLLWDEWEDFITGGPDGTFVTPPPTWSPISNGEGTLWDYLGFPINTIPAGHLPLQFPMNAYNFIYNEYYRDQNLETEIERTSELIQNRAWEKDYFTSSLPWQQRGTPPAFVAGTSSAVWQASTQGGPIPVEISDFDYGIRDDVNPGSLTAMNNNNVDLTDFGFDIADLRLAFQIQKWLERNARAGVRYTEFLSAHYGVAPRDDRMMRPEYVGGTKSAVIISEVLQTSSSGFTDGPISETAQGNLAGHGISANRTLAGNYTAKEHGLIMGIMSVMPRTAYQQGVNRQWIKPTKYDFFFPEFANLSEQAILQGEIFASDTDTENTTLFGYQGRYDEYRVKRSMVCAQMRSDATQSLDYWHLARDFDTAPLLNHNFIKCIPSKRIFAVEDEDGLVVNCANLIKAVRPIPYTAEPGLIDHH